MAARRIAGQVLFWLLVALIVVYTIFPFYWAIVSSLKSGSALFTVEAWPTEPSIANYVSVFSEQPFGRNILNSVIVATAVVALSLFLAVTASHALGRVQFRGRSPLLLMILAVSMFPQVAVLSGLFEVIRWLGLYNNLLGLILAYMIFTLPFTVWVLTTFMRELPKELEEAAVVDGASPWIVLTRVFLPLLWPALVTTGLLAFIAAWNEFMFALAFTSNISRQTVPVGIANFTNLYYVPWGDIAAASIVVTVPLILLVLFFQRHIIESLTLGAVKE